jgi:two-component system KDP operon response regulator KdpE
MTHAIGTRVLVVEDDAPMRRFLTTLLETNSFAVVVARNFDEALRAIAAETFELVLLDLGIPGGSGVEVLRRLREWSNVPVVVVSARHDDAEKIGALDAGADDYLTKPFSAGELLARARAALRRASLSAGDSTPVFDAGGLVVDQTRRVVLVDGTPVAITPTEYRILQILTRNAGRVVTHSEILRAVWGPHATLRAHYVRVHMAQLRKKLGDNPLAPRFIQTESGVGYRLLVR